MFIPGTRLSIIATVHARHSTMTSLSGGKRGITSTAGCPGRREFARYAANPCSIKSALKVKSPVSTRRPPNVNHIGSRPTVAIFRESGEKVFSFYDNIGVFEDLKEGVTEPLSEFVEWHKRFET